MTDQDFRPIGWDFIAAEYMRALPSGLDGLPLTSVPTVPLPAGHPDRDTWDSDLRDIARLGRQLWIQTRNGNRPEIPDPEQVYEDMDGADILCLLADGVDKFAQIADDIAAWKAA